MRIKFSLPSPLLTAFGRFRKHVPRESDQGQQKEDDARDADDDCQNATAPERRVRPRPQPPPSCPQRQCDDQADDRHAVRQAQQRAEHFREEAAVVAGSGASSARGHQGDNVTRRAAAVARPRARSHGKFDGVCLNLRGVTFRVAIIGVGAIAELIATALGEIPAAQLVAGSCRTEAKGRNFAERFSCAWYGDSEAMLDKEKPDVAVVCTPSGAHLEATLACAQRKIHVICEKPLEITTARARRLIDATQRAGVRLGAIFPQRFNPVNVAVRDAAFAGRFGNLSVVHAAMPWWRDDAYYAPNRWQGKIALDGGGALMNQAIHTVDLMQWLAAATMPHLRADENPVAEVFAVTAKRGHDEKLIEVEDTAAVVMKFRNGAVGQILAATSMYPGVPRRLHIAGRDGFAEVLEDQLTTFQFRNEHPDDAATRQRFGRATQHGGGASSPMAMSHENHRRNLEDFFLALSQDREPALTATEAAKAVQIIDACYESARTNRPVRLEAFTTTAAPTKAHPAPRC